MNKKTMLMMAAGLVMAGGLAASKSFAATQCWMGCVNWGTNFNISCSEGSSSVNGTVGSNISGDGTRNLAAQMTASNVRSDQYARVRAIGIASNGSVVSGCDTGWDYTVNGASVYDTSGCNSATQMRGYSRISLTSTTDANFGIPFP